MAQAPLDVPLAQQAVDAYLECGQSKTKASELLGLSINTFNHRLRVAKSYGLIHETAAPHRHQAALPYNVLALDFTEPTTLVVASDFHVWPNYYTDAYWICVQITEDLASRGKVVFVVNGDAKDGAQISRHGRIGWDVRPDVAQELEAVKDWLSRFEAVTDQLYWNLGNHDMRFSSRLATVAPEYQGVRGMRLEDHFPAWRFQWGLMVNGNCMIKHRYKGGSGAGRNNTLYSGVSMITGHDHHLQITRFTDYNGTRYGAQGGTLADPRGPMFDYTEGSPTDWQPGFIVAHFDGPDHRIEDVEVRNGKAWFGGRLWRA